MIAPQDAGRTRDDALGQMHRIGVGVGFNYLSLPEHPIYQERFGWHPEQSPNAMRIGDQTISLPLSSKLVDSDVDRIIDSFWNLLQNRALLAKTG